MQNELNRYERMLHSINTWIVSSKIKTKSLLIISEMQSIIRNNENKNGFFVFRKELV